MKIKQKKYNSVYTLKIAWQNFIETFSQYLTFYGDEMTNTCVFVLFAGGHRADVEHRSAVGTSGAVRGRPGAVNEASPPGQSVDVVLDGAAPERLGPRVSRLVVHQHKKHKVHDALRADRKAKEVREEDSRSWNCHLQKSKHPGEAEQDEEKYELFVARCVQAGDVVATDLDCLEQTARDQQEYYHVANHNRQQGSKNCGVETNSRWQT